MWGSKSDAQKTVDDHVVEPIISRYLQEAQARMAKKDELVLFLDTDWGIPFKEVPAGIAKRYDLAQFSGKWVTREEYKVLLQESRSYSVIRWMGGVLIVGGIVYAIMGTLFAVESQQISPLAASFVAVGIGAIISGAGLLALKRWAPYVTVVVLLTGLAAPITIFIATGASVAAHESLSKALTPVFAGLLMSINFFMKMGRKIFRTRGAVTVPAATSGSFHN